MPAKSQSRWRRENDRRDVGDATSLDEEKTIVRRLNWLAVDYDVYAPLGVLMRHYAWRKSVSGIVRAPLPLFWGVSKTA